MSCTTGFGRCDYLDFLQKQPQGTAKILGTSAFAGAKTPAALKFSSKDATTDCAETPVNCPHCGQKWRLRRRLRRQPFILLSFSSSKKLRKAQETQSCQGFQHTGHTAFKGLSNAVTNTHPLLPSMGTTRQKSSCRNRLQNGLRLLSQAKWVHTRLSEKDRTQGLTRRNTGVSDGGGITTLGAFHTFRKPCVARCQNGKLCRFWVLAGDAPEERRKPAEQRCAYARRCSEASRPRWAA